MARRYHHHGCRCGHCINHSMPFGSDHEELHKSCDQDPCINASQKRNYRRGILKSFTRQKYDDQQVDDLHDTLDDANFTMSENEKLLSDYRSTNIRRSMELDELRSELEKSKDQLSSRCSSPQQVVHFHTSSAPVAQEGNSKYEHQRLLHELELEKRSRERAEIERSQLVKLLDTSLKGHTKSANYSCDNVTSELSEHLRNLQDVLKESQLKSASQDTDVNSRLKEIEGKLNECTASERTSQRLVEELQKFKDDLWKRETHDKKTELTKELRLLENELLSERKLLDSSRQQSDKLASKVDELRFQRNQVQQEKNKALSCLEVTTQRLDKTLNGQRELEKHVQDLKQQISLSEKERAAWEEKCTMLLKECKLQMAKQEHDRDKITEMESKLANYRADKLVTEEKYMKIEKEVTEKNAEEDRLKEQCKELQLKLMENSSEKERTEDIKQKLNAVEHECQKREMEACQLQVELEAAAVANTSLQNQIHLLEHDFHTSEKKSEDLGIKLNEVSSQLKCRENEVETILEELGAWKAQAHTLMSDKKELELEVSAIKSQLVSSQEAIVTNQTQAQHTAKKHKQKCKLLEQENLKVKHEKEQLVLQMEETLRSREECSVQLKNRESLLSAVHQENEDLKEAVKELESHRDHQEKECDQFRQKLSELRCNLVARRAEVEKCEVKLKECQNEKEMLFKENILLKEELSQAQEECSQAKEMVAIQVNESEEMSRAEILNLKSELQSCREENTHIKEKLSKFSRACQTLKAELAKVNTSYEQKQREVSGLEEQLEETYLKTSKREHSLSSEFSSLKATHDREVESLQKNHKHTASKLQQRISKLEIQLADEQSTVRAMRRHQLQLFGDHQKIIQDDLTKSLDDTEKLRGKYIEAKRIYEEKEASLEAEVSKTCKEEIESLRQQLAKYQSLLRQQSEDNEVILRATAGEVDELVKTIGKRVHIPVFPTVVEQESGTKNWTAEIMAKFQWLQKEMSDIVALEVKLRRKLKEQFKDQRHGKTKIQRNELDGLHSQLTDSEH